MKIRSTPRRLAPIVRRIAMSRVFARTSMISDESDVERGDEDDDATGR